MNLTNINTIKPFGRFCVTLGMIPTSYKESMSYEEQLIWFCNFLETKVIPAIDNNAEAVTELQNLFLELKNYVDNYFENLDVQQEINNKLDDMAESGELAEIIAQYVELGCVFGYDTVTDLGNAENLTEGSICYTTGHLSYNDGKGAYYRIRQLTLSDVIDGFNIVAITNSDNLIGERLSNYYINELNTNVTQLRTDVDNITNKKWIFIGDSYSQGYNPDGNVTGWSTLLKNLMGLDSSTCIIADYGGAGFANPSHPFEEIISDLTSDNDVTDILIAGGYNDISFSYSDIFNGMSDCMTLIETKFPNAKVHLAFIGGTLNEYHGDIFLRRTYYMTGCTNLGIDYLPNLEYVLYDSRYFGTDNIHPNQNGQNAISKALYQALNGGYKYAKFEDLTLDVSQSDNFNSTTFPLHLYSNNDISQLMSHSGSMTFNASSTFSLNYNGSVKLGKLTQYGIIGSKYTSNNRYSICDVIIRSTSNPAGYYTVPARITVNENGYMYLYLVPMTTDDHSNYQSYANVTQIQIPIFTIIYPTDVL